MKKLLMAILCFALVSLISIDPVDAKDTVVNAQNIRQEKIYKNNSEFFDSQSTDAKSLKLFLRPSYDIESDNEEIIALAKTITASLTDDIAKVQAIHDYVSDNIYYDYDALSEEAKYLKEHKNTKTYVDENGVKRTIYYDLEDSYDDLSIKAQSAVEVLKNKKGVCAGYTNLTCALLRAVGIPSQAYLGSAGSEGDTSSWQGHAWTGAYISSQKRWMILDTTWDSNNRYSDGKFIKGNKTKQTYFDPDLYTFSLNHKYNIPVHFDDLYFEFINVSMIINGKEEFDYQYDEHKGQLQNYDSWVSSNPKVATVNQEGEVIAHDYGTTTISIARLDGSGIVTSFQVTVEPQKLKEIWGQTSLTVGDTDNLYVSIVCDLDSKMNKLYAEFDKKYGDDEDFEESKEFRERAAALNKLYPEVIFDEDVRYVKWKSSNSKVLKVDQTGKITAVGPGKATITASNLEGTSSIKEKFEVFPALTGITISHKTLTVKPKSEVDILSVKYAPKTAKEPILRWESSNPKVVEMDEYGGYFTALKEGSAIITVSAVEYRNGTEEVVLFSDTCKVTVKAEKKASGVKLDKTTATLTQGKTITLKATIAPTNANNKTVTWSSSNSKIATVSQNGIVTAKSKGTVTITCKTSNGKTATCKVTVK